MARVLVRHVGGDICRTHFGAWAPGEEDLMEAEDLAFVERHLPGRFVRVEGDAKVPDPPAQTKPYRPRTK